MARKALYKLCPHCDTRKPRHEFHMDRQRKDGLTWICKECRSLYEMRRRRERNALPVDLIHARCGGLLVYAVAGEPAMEGYARCEECRRVGVPV